MKRTLENIGADNEIYLVLTSIGIQVYMPDGTIRPLDDVLDDLTKLEERLGTSGDKVIRMATNHPMTIGHAITLIGEFGDKAEKVAKALDEERFQFTRLDVVSIQRAIETNEKFEKAVEKVMQDEQKDS